MADSPVSKHKNEASSDSETKCGEKKCANCLMIFKATDLYRCETCSNDMQASGPVQLLCDTCVTAGHIRKQHKIVDSKTREPLVCSTHRNLCSMFCESCSEAFCLSCLPHHGKHDYLAIEEKAKEVRVKVFEMITKMEKTEKPARLQSEHISKKNAACQEEGERLIGLVEKEIEKAKNRIIKDLQENLDIVESLSVRAKDNVISIVDLQGSLRQLLGSSNGIAVHEFFELENKFDTVLESFEELTNTDIESKRFMVPQCCEEYFTKLSGEFLKMVDLPNIVKKENVVTQSKQFTLSSGESLPVMNPPEQKAEVENLCRKSLRKGDKWYLISCTWMRAFKKYCDSCGDDTLNAVSKAAHPGPINNSDILNFDGRSVKSSLLENVDFDLVPEQCWRLLLHWYGILPFKSEALQEDSKPNETEQRLKTLNAELEADPGAPLGEIRRFVFEEGCYIKFMKIEVYYLELNVYKFPDNKFCYKVKMSKSNTIEQLRDKLKHIYGIGESKNVRLYGNFGSEMHEISKMNTTLQDEGLFSNQQITIEVQNEDGSWPKKASVVASSSYTSGGTTNKLFNASTSSVYSTPNANVPGLCGLSNLGNTCFMNSALQCMSNVPPLTEYFRKNYHKEEINTENPLGMKGEIAKEYGDLMQTIWSGNSSSVPPRSFKNKVGMFAPRFSGFQQHDSQELLSFLLDGLHEDLNRVKNKPYIEAKDDDNRNDDILAKEAWENHLKRNDSIIVDMFHGQFKSTLVCPDCQKVSVTFDPYCFLSLPLPVKKLKSYDITFFKLNLEKPPAKLRVIVGDGCTVHEFQTAVSEVLDKAVKPGDMVTTQVYNSRIHKTLQGDDTIGSMYSRDEYAVFETPTGFGKPDAGFRFVPLLFREKNTPKSMANSYSCFGYPLFVKIPKEDITYDELYSIIHKRIKPFLVKEENIDPKDLAGLKLDDNTDVSAEKQNGTSGDVKMHNGVDKSLESCANEDIDNFDDKGNHLNNTEVQNGHAENEEASCNEADVHSSRHYFKISAVYSTGSTEIQKLPRKGTFQLTAQAYLACDWNHEAKQILFRPVDELVVPHESLDVKLELKKTIHLEDCIKQFLVAEKQWYCPKCKDLKEATKKFDLWTLPHVLVIHLKRFSYNRFFRDKLDNKIDFPTRQLELNEFVTNANVGHQVYDLIGVVNHYGGLGEGHYTAYVKHEPTGKWYDFDDSRVSPLQGGEDAVKTSAAYVLFYRRRERTEINIVPLRLRSHTNPDAVKSSVDDQMETI